MIIFFTSSKNEWNQCSWNFKVEQKPISFIFLKTVQKGRYLDFKNLPNWEGKKSLEIVKQVFKCNSKNIFYSFCRGTKESHANSKASQKLASRLLASAVYLIGQLIHRIFIISRNILLVSRLSKWTEQKKTPIILNCLLKPTGLPHVN